MEDLDKLLEQANLSLNKKLKKLDVLEKEKHEIIDRYENATPADKILLKIEMKKSEEKFKKLCNEVLTLSEKVKKLKKRYC